MGKGTTISCPHCHNVGPCVWTGYGKNWVMCPSCQRRLRWTEVQALHLVESGAALSRGEQYSIGYH